MLITYQLTNGLTKLFHFKPINRTTLGLCESDVSHDKFFLVDIQKMEQGRVSVLVQYTSCYCQKHAYQVWSHLDLQWQSYALDKENKDTYNTTAESNPYMSSNQATQQYRVFFTLHTMISSCPLFRLAPPCERSVITVNCLPLLSSWGSRKTCVIQFVTNGMEIHVKPFKHIDRSIFPLF